MSYAEDAAALVRLEKLRLIGRDRDGSWLRAGFFAVAAAMFFVFAARA